MPEPPQLTEFFHKARRQLALFSGILLAWEYVGIRLGGSGGSANLCGHTSETTTSTIPGDITVTICHPRALPLVIALLILYFALRLIIEWRQNSPERRSQTASQIDLAAALVLAAAALTVYGVQQVSEFRIADALTPLLFVGIFVGFFVTGTAYFAVYKNIPEFTKASSRLAPYIKHVFPTITAVIFAIAIANTEQEYPIYNIGLIVGVGLVLAVAWIKTLLLPRLQARPSKS